ncbi:MAG TPA: iron-sulfur cluster-binding domain-containing protein [Pseudoneobacillus sp.]|nr:iron-sulfur cluster-binding domain-containing protein [Pseudoneobacillus sp.]
MTTNSLLNHMIGTHIYVCGPDSFITSFTEAANGIGYPKSSVHIERFTPTQIKMPSSFQVTLSSGERVQVSKEQSLLDALLEAGKRIPYSCRVGRCGTCELKVLEGEIEHHDSFLSEEQRKSNHVILSCVSRAKADKLTLDF